VSIGLLCAKIGLFCVMIGLFCVNIGFQYEEIPWGVFICMCDITHLNTLCMENSTYMENALYIYEIRFMYGEYIRRVHLYV